MYQIRFHLEPEFKWMSLEINIVTLILLVLLFVRQINEGSHGLKHNY